MPGAKSGMAGIEGRFFHSFECRENPADRSIDFNKDVDVSHLETGIRRKNTCSDESSYITGIYLPVDGGMVAV
jgi:hypothetical protein